jgi:cytochrome c peroxidase
MKWLLILTSPLTFTTLFLAAQSRSAYGPSRIWWEAGQGGLLSRSEDYENPDGLSGMVNTSGSIRTDGHPFFEALGTNGRACITCHQPSNAMSVSTAAIRRRWTETEGRDPIFAAIDGSNCPNLPQEAEASHSLLLNRGVFRIVLSWPPRGVRPDFELDLVRDPTGCNRKPSAISVFRRPRVVANQVNGLTLMADGRDPNLRNQAIAAAIIHEQMSAPPTDPQLAQILEFEKQIFVAQSADIRGGLLGESNGPGFLGPDSLAAGKAGSPVGIPGPISAANWIARPGIPVAGIQKDFRESVARGSELFLHRAFKTGPQTTGTCASCHNERASTSAMEIGTTNHAPAEAAPELPLFKATCDSGAVVYTQDPGRALITGKCADIGAIVPQQLRGLAARAPYFASGSASTLRQVVDFHDSRYSIGYTEAEKQDLVNFLKSL